MWMKRHLEAIGVVRGSENKKTFRGDAGNWGSKKIYVFEIGKKSFAVECLAKLGKLGHVCIAVGKEKIFVG